jgi:alkanesulfonate monooxygenase SsuD/methylene tetrahydromethanopterin reductase-like flavin-dependent oxidoreductase (luciferase family)
MARSVDHISNGRLILGMGSGWYKKDYDEYGYEFGTASSRLKKLDRAMPIVEERLQRLNPLPLRRRIPILIGDGGEKATLWIVAEHAHIWNGFGDPQTAGRKNIILDDWCTKVRRNHKEIERSILIRPEQIRNAEEYVAIGITYLILGFTGPTYELEPLLKNS